jgi:hypothetical protein
MSELDIGRLGVDPVEIGDLDAPVVPGATGRQPAWLQLRLRWLRCCR